MQITKDQALDAARVAVELGAVIVAIIGACIAVFAFGYTVARIVEVVL